jgi:hypothetical protein
LISGLRAQPAGEITRNLPQLAGQRLATSLPFLAHGRDSRE